MGAMVSVPLVVSHVLISLVLDEHLPIEFTHTGQRRQRGVPRPPLMACVGDGNTWVVRVSGLPAAPGRPVSTRTGRSDMNDKRRSQLGATNRERRSPSPASPSRSTAPANEHIPVRPVPWGARPLHGRGPERPVPVSWAVHGANLKLRQRFPDALWFIGEVVRIQRSRGHLFATLAEKGARLEVHLPPRSNGTREIPRQGSVVLVKGTLRIYTPRGGFQVEASEIRTTGCPGIEAARRELARNQLKQEGVFGRPKRELPPWPGGIALVTSLDGAVLHDVRAVLARRASWVRLRVFNARVQGKAAAGSLVAAIRDAEASLCDLVIIARGGGGPQDLTPFDDPDVVRTLSGCRIPVISAIGHERDQTLANLAADVSVATPSAAAEIAVPDGAELRRHLEGARKKLVAAASRQFDRTSVGLDRRLVRSKKGVDASLKRLWRRLRRECPSQCPPADHELAPIGKRSAVESAAAGAGRDTAIVFRCSLGTGCLWTGPAQVEMWHQAGWSPSPLGLCQPER